MKAKAKSSNLMEFLHFFGHKKPEHLDFCLLDFDFYLAVILWSTLNQLIKKYVTGFREPFFYYSPSDKIEFRKNLRFEEFMNIFYYYFKE